MPDLEDIVAFEELVTGGTCPEQSVEAARSVSTSRHPCLHVSNIVMDFRILDSVIGNLAKNFAEGTEYFKVRFELLC